MYEKNRHGAGIWYALGAYGWWGVVPPVYFKSLSHVSAFEILAHRIVWSTPLLLIWLASRRQLRPLARLPRQSNVAPRLLLSTVLIAINWFVYVHAVTTDQIVQGSLGYFINPLVNVVLGVVVLKESLRPGQWLAVTLAALGVAMLTWSKGQLPWIALTLAASFGTYGLVRKRMPIDGTLALAAEFSILTPICLVGLLVAPWMVPEGVSHDARTFLLLSAGSIVTVLPLIWFGHAAKQLPLSTLGFIQYLAPSLQFLIGVLWNREPVQPLEWSGFVMIWTALAIYSTEEVRSGRSTR